MRARYSWRLMRTMSSPRRAHHGHTSPVAKPAAIVRASTTAMPFVSSHLPLSAPRALLLATGFAVLGLTLAKTNNDILNSGQELGPLWTDQVLDDDQSPVVSNLQLEPASDAPATAPVATTQSSKSWTSVKIRSSDTADSVFARLDLKRSWELVRKLEPAGSQLQTLRAGDRLRVRTSPRGLEELVYKPVSGPQLHVERRSDSFVSYRQADDGTPNVHMVSGTITRSLLADTQDSGLSEPITLQLAALFGWDVDFSRRAGRGDRFNVIYESRDPGQQTGHDIVAAEYTSDGQTYRAFRYTDSKGVVGYYTEDGRSMRRPFLRSPVNFTRISSTFSLARLHPILNAIRAHRGVDYAAATGTPIMAAGNGRIVFMDTKGGYGKTVVLRHGTHYSTLYAHMSQFRSGLSMGSSVKQGDVIGYVGKSGLATGPHLHYEFRIDGVHHDPLTVKLPEAKLLPKPELARYEATIQPLVARLGVSDATVATAPGKDWDWSGLSRVLTR